MEAIRLSNEIKELRTHLALHVSQDRDLIIKKKGCCGYPEQPCCLTFYLEREINNKLEALAKCINNR